MWHSTRDSGDHASVLHCYGEEDSRRCLGGLADKLLPKKTRYEE